MPPSINQIEYHPYLQHGPLLPFHNDEGIANAASRPLTAVTKAKPGPFDAVMAELAKKYYVTEGGVSLRWCLDQGVVAITTSGKQQRLSDYLRSMTFNLTRRECQAVAEVGKNKHYKGFWQARFDENDRS